MADRSTRRHGQLRGKIWTQRDRFGNDIYLTHERWDHIIDPDNHPEVEPYGDHLRETIRLGRRISVLLRHWGKSRTWSSLSRLLAG